MKILKIFLVLVIPTMVLISCQKSDRKPGTCGNSNASTTPNTETQATAGRVQSAPATEVKGNDIVGTGDDDRDGGEKKKKMK